MRPSLSNRVVIATAGSGKTARLIKEALTVNGRALIVTFTLANQQQIIDRIRAQVGVIPSHITVMGWFAFLLAHGARPYQRVITKEAGLIKGLNFKGARHRFTKRANFRSYYFDSRWDMYRDGVADFVYRANNESDGAVVKRLERVFDYIFIDEVQDLAGYDLEILDLLFKANLSVLAVGDPRQHTFETNKSNKYKKYRGPGFVQWVRERDGICVLEQRTENYRSVQEICDFADSIYPEYRKSTSMVTDVTGHDGVFAIHRSKVPEYYEKYGPVVLRYNRRFQTEGLPATNIGVSKGSTYDRVLLFPTKPMRDFFTDRNPGNLGDHSRLYVAVTRARYSVAFVVDD